MERYRKAPARVVDKIRRFQKARKTEYGWLVYAVNRWLATIGYFYCPACHGAVDLGVKSKGRYKRCKPCTAKHVKRWNQQLKARDPEAYRARTRANNQKQAERRRLRQVADGPVVSADAAQESLWR